MTVPTPFTPVLPVSQLGTVTTNKFIRNYILQIQGNRDKTEYFTFIPPLTLEFNIERNIFMEANKTRE